MMGADVLRGRRELSHASELWKSKLTHYQGSHSGLAHPCSAKTEVAPPFVVFEGWALLTSTPSLIDPTNCIPMKLTLR